jgi:hypothetical protein
MWCFNRDIDSNKIETESLVWKGPFSWPGYSDKIPAIPDVRGVYLFTFMYKDGFVLYSVGITNSTKKRISQHTSSYKRGKYNVLDVACAMKGERREIWHGWSYAQEHKEEYIRDRDTILRAVNDQLSAYRLFVLEVIDVRKRERIEAAIIKNLSLSKESWAGVADRGMHFTDRSTSEMPINLRSIFQDNHTKIYGLPELLEI